MFVLLAVLNEITRRKLLTDAVSVELQKRR